MLSKVDVCHLSAHQLKVDEAHAHVARVAAHVAERLARHDVARLEVAVAEYDRKLRRGRAERASSGMSRFRSGMNPCTNSRCV